jgi:hypothetical protein
MSFDHPFWMVLEFEGAKRFKVCFLNCNNVSMDYVEAIWSSCSFVLQSLSSRIWCLHVILAVHVILAGVKDTQQRSYKNWADVFTLFDGTKRSEKLTKL